MLSLLITLVIIGFVVYLLTTFIPMDPKIKQLIVIVAVVVCLLVVLRAFGIWTGGPVLTLRS